MRIMSLPLSSPLYVATAVLHCLTSLSCLHASRGQGTSHNCGHGCRGAGLVLALILVLVGASARVMVVVVAMVGWLVVLRMLLLLLLSHHASAYGCADVAVL